MVALGVAFISSVAVLRCLVELRILTLRPGQVTLWGASSRVVSARVVGERELEVRFEHGGSVSLWLPRPMLRVTERERNAPASAVERAINAVSGDSIKESG